MRPAELIEQKRNGEEHDPAELAELVLAYARDEVPDYQMAAWCMAVYFNGLTAAETHALTDAMIRSGETLDLGAALGRKVVDKHSTGGVGDKTSLAVGPIVAACGVPLGKMSGRGLGHTGGTLDKLESIPGFRVELTTDELVAQLREVGIAIVGQTADLVPADKKLYALRDVTATVDIVPLIASSIMSKKLAAGAEAIVLDVKVGDGAFMKTLDDARVLAEQMREIGVAGRARGDLPADRHGPAARTRRRERARGRRGARHAARRRPGRLHRARPRRLRAAPRVLRSRDRRRRRASPRRGGGRGRQRPRRRTSAGSVRRAATRIPMRSSARPSSCRCRHRGTAWSRASGRSRSASRRSSSAPAAARRTTRSTTPSASSASRSAATPSSQATTSPRCTPATTHAAERAAAAVLAAYELGDEAPPERGIVLDVVA